MIFMLLMNLIVLSFPSIALGLKYASTCEERKGRVGMMHVNELLIRFRGASIQIAYPKIISHSDGKFCVCDCPPTRPVEPDRWLWGLADVLPPCMLS